MNTSEQLITLIRELVKEETKSIDRSLICVVDSVSYDGTLNIKLLSDENTVLSNIPNNSGYEFKSGDYAILYKLGNTLSNAFVFNKVTKDPIKIGDFETVINNGSSSSGYSGPLVSSLGGLTGDITIGDGLAINGQSLYANYQPAIEKAVEESKQYTDEQLETIELPSAFTNEQTGTIQGSSSDGYVAADNGFGKVNGWDSILNRLDNLEYVPISLISFTKTGTTVFELGSTVDDVSFIWTANKTPSSLKINSTNLSTPTQSSGTVTLAEQGLTTTTTYTLTAGDGKNNSSRTATIYFYRGLYYGVSATDITTSAQVISLNELLRSSRSCTFTVNAGAGQYIWFCLPTVYGTPTFNVGGFDGGFKDVLTLNVTNKSGRTEEYHIWKSDNVNLGSTTVTVK